MDPHIRKLIARRLNNTNSPAEDTTLDVWINASPDNRRFMDSCMRREQADAAMSALTQMDSERMRRELERKLGEPMLVTLPQQKKARILPMRYARIAAVFLVVAAGAFLWRKRSSPSPLSTEAGIAMSLISPTKPMLQVGDGSPLSLEEIPLHGTLDKDGLRFSRLKERAVSLEPIASRDAKTVLLSIPFGQSWQFLLPGANISIAPGSALALLPEKDHIKEIALNGEAYFEVTRDPQTSFVVSNGTTRNEVLGTSFNVSANKNSCITTLISGKVKISLGSSSQILKPGEEGQTSDKDVAGIQIRQGVDTAEILAWRSEFFRFDNLNLRQFMRQVTRWYGMKGVRFDKGVDTTTKGMLGGGHVGKDVGLPKLLNILHEDNHLIFQVKDSTIYVSPEPLTSFANNSVIKSFSYTSFILLHQIQ